MNPDKVIHSLEKFFFWGSVALLVAFLFTVHVLHRARAPFAKEEYYRLGLYDKPILYPTPAPYVPTEKWVTEAEQNAATGEARILSPDALNDLE